MYCVVETMERDVVEVSAAPKLWIEEDKLFWPNGSANRKKPSKKKDNWKMYDFRMLEDSISTFEEALVREKFYSNQEISGYEAEKTDCKVMKRQTNESKHSESEADESNSKKMRTQEQLTIDDEDEDVRNKDNHDEKLSLDRNSIKSQMRSKLTKIAVSETKPIAALKSKNLKMLSVEKGKDIQEKGDKDEKLAEMISLPSPFLEIEDETMNSSSQCVQVPDFEDEMETFEEASAMQQLYLQNQNSEMKAEQNDRKKLKRRHPVNNQTIQSNRSAATKSDSKSIKPDHPPNKKMTLSNQTDSESEENNLNKMNTIFVPSSSKLERLQTKGEEDQKKIVSNLGRKTRNKTELESKYMEIDDKKSEDLVEDVTESILQPEQAERNHIIIEKTSTVNNSKSESLSNSSDNHTVSTISGYINQEPSSFVHNTNDRILSSTNIGFNVEYIYKEVLDIKAACATEISERMQMEARMQANFDKLNENISKISKLLSLKDDHKQFEIPIARNIEHTQLAEDQIITNFDYGEDRLTSNDEILTSEITDFVEEVDLERQEGAIDARKNQVVESESEASDAESVDEFNVAEENVYERSDNAESESDADSIPEPETVRDTIKLTLIESNGAGTDNFYDEQGYLYSKNNVGTSKRLYLRCKNSTKYTCFARATVGNDFENAVLTIKHNHPADSQFLDRAKFSKKLDDNCEKDPFATAQVLYLRTKQQMKRLIDTANIPSQNSFDIDRRRLKYLPKLPHTVDEFEELIAHEKYRQHLVDDLKKLPFYRGVWKSSRGEKNVVYISEIALKLLNTLNNVALFGDGTHKVLPNHMKFRQLYIINLIYKNKSYPLAYIFMEKKTFTSYDAVFANLKLLMPSVDVVKVMTDYESATRKALRKHYPNARICGCFFHYVQAVMKMTKKFGLRNDQKFKIAIKRIAALALLPNQFVVPGFDIIDEEFKKKKSQRWNKFRTYWMRQWAGANISVYGLVHRTNNFSESFNKILNQLVKSRNPNIWVLISNLKLLEMNNSDEIQRASQGQMHEPKRNRNMVRLNEKIMNATKLFDQSQDIKAFLENTTYEEDLELFVKDHVNIEAIDVDNGIEEDVVPNYFNSECNFRQKHPRIAATRNVLSKTNQNS